MYVQPYIDFNGRCDEALEFYKTAVGAEVTMLLRFKDSPDPDSCPPGSQEKVMHSSFKVGTSVVNATDGYATGVANFQGISLSLSVHSDAEAEKVFAALEKGGQIKMPLTKTFFSPKFGMLTDRFGVSWMILVCAP